jgi:hypothetical protein
VKREIKPSLWRRIANSLRHSRRRRRATVDLTKDGFVFSTARTSIEIKWNDIDEIDAGVRDFITYDTFYVVVFANGGSLTIEEFHDGFRQLEHAMLERWPQIKERWQKLFGLPLHEVRYDVLWRRGDAA